VFVAVQIEASRLIGGKKLKKIEIVASWCLVQMCN
jgi:hypothetical protein